MRTVLVSGDILGGITYTLRLGNVWAIFFIRENEAVLCRVPVE